MANVLKIDQIEKYYGNKSNLTKAIDGISFEVGKVNSSLLWVQVEVEKQHY